jgi:hypothetical protein
MSEYDDLLRSLLVERYRPITQRRAGDRSHLAELEQELRAQRRRRKSAETATIRTPQQGVTP